MSNITFARVASTTPRQVSVARTVEVVSAKYTARPCITVAKSLDRKRF